MKKAFFSIGPSFYRAETRQYAGWVGIYDLMLESLREEGFDVVIPEYDERMIDDHSTVSKITSWDLWAADQMPYDTQLFLGAPGYSLAQIMKLSAMWEETHDEQPFPRKIVTVVFNNADWWRDQQLAQEYKGFGYPYDLSPTWRWINRRALELSDRVIACSPFVKNTHAKLVPEAKIGIAPWGVDSARFTPDWAWQEAHHTPLRVLFVGSDPIRKGLPYLLAAVAPLEGVEVVIAGCKIPEPTATGLEGKVKILGLIPHADMPKVMREAHIVAIPSLEDGVACSLQEGMASGLVPIGTPDVAEVFTTSEYQGVMEYLGYKGARFMVPFRDIDGIANNLVFLRDHPEVRARWAMAARALAEKQSWGLFKAAFKREVREAMM